MSANLTSGSSQSYDTPGINIFQGLRPDVVAIQEFRYNGSAADTQLRQLVDTAFDPSFSYYRENYTASGDLPNGIISRWPILSSGSWVDPVVSNRGFAWAQLDLPGTNDLYVVSVHLYSSGSVADRNTEATTIKNNIMASFPSNAWIVVAGDFNTSARSEAAVTTFKTFLSDNPIPADQAGDQDTSAPRSKPYDYLLPSFSFTNSLVAVAISNQFFPNGLVFDSRVYAPLVDVSPVQSADSGAANMQHMGVIKDFNITYTMTNSSADAPSITAQPQSQTAEPGSNATFMVVATGAPTLNYQWRFGRSDIASATASSLPLTNVQPEDAGSYAVVITNSIGSVTSSVVTLTVGTLPMITAQPQSQSVTAGATVGFSVTATGTLPLAYQWRLNGTNIAGATTTSYELTNVHTNDTGNYSVVITNAAGTITSADAVLTVGVPQSPIIAQWDFNSSPADGNTATGTSVPSLGAGTASLLGGITQSFATGSSTDPASSDNSGWNTATYPNSTAGNKTAGVQFDVSTAGRQNISIRWDQRDSSTGSKYFRLRYTSNGTDFVDFPTGVSVASVNFEPKTNSLMSFPGVNNNSNFAFRIVAEFESTATGAGNPNYVGATGTYATTGTTRFDMVTVSGDAIPPANPPAPALLSACVLDTNRCFQFALSGTTGVNYIVQASTNLSDSNWVSLLTNAAPFRFVDTNTSFFTQRFFRSLSLPEHH